MIVDGKMFKYSVTNFGNTDGYIINISDISYFKTIVGQKGETFYSIVLRDGNSPKYALTQSEFDELYKDWLKNK